jgi:predicted SAM-dependent methyltransferase
LLPLIDGLAAFHSFVVRATPKVRALVWSADAEEGWRFASEEVMMAWAESQDIPAVRNHASRWAGPRALSSYLKRSHSLVGLAKARRGLARDIRLVVWLVRRRSKIADYLKTHPVKKLQLGTSNNTLDGWLNTDIVPNRDSVIYLDATRRFPFENNTFNYIMAEHMIEHIEYDAAQLMLKECIRVLKPGGRVRFATPDLGILLALHRKEKTDAQRQYVDWAIARFMPEIRECKDVFVINNFFRSWGHCFLYDQDALQHALYSSGFREIKFYKPGASEDLNLKKLESHGRELGSEDINQFETIVVEGCKANPPK